MPWLPWEYHCHLFCSPAERECSMNSTGDRSTEIIMYRAGVALGAMAFLAMTVLLLQRCKGTQLFGCFFHIPICVTLSALQIQLLHASSRGVCSLSATPLTKHFLLVLQLVTPALFPSSPETTTKTQQQPAKVRLSCSSSVLTEGTVVTARER